MMGMDTSARLGIPDCRDPWSRPWPVAFVRDEELLCEETDAETVGSLNSRQSH